MEIKSILIANRGEIAVRIIRACRESDIRPVAVFSEADRTSPHVVMADEAIHIGQAAAAESYLKKERIIAAAKQAGVDAIHPGYGFLSEDAEFAGMVEQEGLIFIGPPADAIRRMGDKARARDEMNRAGVPIIPGSTTPIDTVDDAMRIAGDIGYPVLLKAVGGGGGKGMRIVENAGEIASAVKGAKNEARNAFGNDALYLEKYIRQPRHIEVQIFADRFGNIVHLGERECSIQRRHQKIIEEAPSFIVDDVLRTRMGEAAIEAARASGYSNAGTVEFLVDEERNFYFLEMNTRIQVEHPVTEMVTGIDIVKEQISVASGNRLSFTQEGIRLRGHAIECRIYAEDPLNNFLPSIGKINSIQSALGPGVREDRGVQPGNDITYHYDPLISKLVVHAPSRIAAIKRMESVLSEYRIRGVITNIPACLFIIRHPAFSGGIYTTRFIEEHFKTSALDTATIEEKKAAAVTAAIVASQKMKSNRIAQNRTGEHSNWKLRQRR